MFCKGGAFPDRDPAAPQHHVPRLLGNTSPRPPHPQNSSSLVPKLGLSSKSGFLGCGGTQNQGDWGSTDLPGTPLSPPVTHGCRDPAGEGSPSATGQTSDYHNGWPTALDTSTSAWRSKKKTILPPDPCNLSSSYTWRTQSGRICSHSPAPASYLREGRIML